MHKQPMSSNHRGNPDKGPKMMEGEHKFDMGYVSDSKHFSPEEGSSDDKYRGNDYMDMQNEACKRDDKKLKANKFSKIA